ncbi:hypothetical protein BDQ17DRAFT_1433912 [Cyathus striatus]|nr:hypothetical protein BDQ17DRAFT_1433912 [Cyathus striatus]
MARRPQEPKGQVEEPEEFEIVLAKHCAAIKQKKNNEKQRTFLQACVNQLNKDLTISTDNLNMCIQAIENSYSEFLVDYTATEDRIRELWSNMQQEQNKLAALIKASSFDILSSTDGGRYSLIFSMPFARLSSRAGMLAKTSYESVTLNLTTIAFFAFSFIYCFSQVILQSLLFSIDSASLDVVSGIVLEGGIPPDSKNMTFLDGSLGQLRLHMCNDVPFLQPSPCFDIFKSGSEEIASCPQSNIQAESVINWEGRINITAVSVNSTFITEINLDFAQGPSVQLNHQCIQIMTFPRQTLSNFRREDITFIFLQFWLFIISFFAVTHASISHIFAVLATRTLNAAWSAYAVWRTRHVEDVFHELISDPNSPCCIMNMFSGYFRSRLMFVIVDLVFNCIALIMASYLSWVLIREYSAQCLKYIGAPKHIDRINKFFMAVLACLQLEAFVLIVALGLWLDVLFNTAIHGISGHSKFYVAAIIITMIILVPWISMGWYAIRREMKKTMILFIFISLAIMIGWATMFYSQVYRWTFLQWPYLGCFTVASFILLIVTILLGLICRLNFGKGHAEYLRAEKALSSSNFSPDVFNKQRQNSNLDLERKISCDQESLPVRNFHRDAKSGSLTEGLHSQLQARQVMTPMIFYEVPYGQPF